MIGVIEMLESIFGTIFFIGVFGCLMAGNDLTMAICFVVAVIGIALAIFCEKILDYAEKKNSTADGQI